MTLLIRDFYKIILKIKAMNNKNSNNKIMRMKKSCLTKFSIKKYFLLNTFL